MKYINILMKKYGERKTGLIVFIVGLVIGVLIARIFKGFYWNELDLLNLSYFNLIVNMEIDYKLLRSYVLWKNFRNYFIIWGLSFTKIGITSIGLVLIFYGFKAGFLITVLLMGYKLKGISLLIGYTFPQFLIYIPLIFISLQGGYWLCKNLYFNGIYKKKRLETVGKYLIFVFVLGIFLLIGSLMETYLGSFVLRAILKTFI